MHRRSNLSLILVIAVITASFAIAELAFRKNVICERCGAAMRPFKEGEPEEDSDILDCPRCDFMVNLRHAMY